MPVKKAGLIATAATVVVMSASSAFANCNCYKTDRAVEANNVVELYRLHRQHLGKEVFTQRNTSFRSANKSCSNRLIKEFQRSQGRTENGFCYAWGHGRYSGLHGGTVIVNGKITKQFVPNGH